MASLDIHLKKYKMFKKDAFNESNSEPTRIEAFFEAAFHLIEATANLSDVHINKHKMVRKMLQENQNIFEEKTETVWRTFQSIETQIRPGQAYGGKINGEKLKEALRAFESIEEICTCRFKKAQKSSFLNPEGQNG